MTVLTHGLPPLALIAAAVIAVVSTARTARLLTWDDFPPIVFLRGKWAAKFGADGWGGLVFCHFCTAPYLAAGMTVWWILGGAHWTWWAINGAWALAYLGAIVVSHDEAE